MTQSRSSSCSFECVVRHRHRRYPAVGAAVALALALALGACTKVPAEVEASAAQHLSRNESRSAMVELKDLLQREPNRPQSRLLLGQAMNDQDDYAGAESELRRALALGASADLVAPPLARAMLYQGRLEEVIKEPLFVDVKEPLARATVLERQASALLSLGRKPEAVPLLEQARQLAPDYGPASATLASMMVSEGRTDEASSLLAAALATSPASAEVHRSYGSLMLALQRPAEAVAYFSKAVDLAVGPPRDRQIQRATLAAVVDIELSQRRTTEAEAALKRLDGLGVGRINGLLRARLLLLKGDVAGGRRELEGLIAGGRSDPEASLLLAIVMLRQGNTGQAETYLKEVLALMPENTTARQILAQLRLQAGKPKEAVAMLEPLLKNASGEVVTLAVQASLAAGDRAAALGVLKRSAAASVGNMTAALEIARGYILAGEPSRALESLPPFGSPEIKEIAATESVRLAAMVASKDLAGAKQLAVALGRRESTNARVQAVLGDFYLQAGDLDSARAALEKADKLDPTDVGIVLRIARLEVLAGSSARAEARLEAALKSDPQASALRSALAELQVARGDSKAALASIQKAQELTPGDNVLLVREAQLRLGQGDTAGAVKATATAAKNAPDDKTVIRARISTLLAAKDNAAAIAVAREALARRPEDPDLHLMLSGAQAAAGDLDAALASFQEASRKFPQSIAVLSAAADFQLRKGDIDGARKTASQLGSIEPNHPSIALIEAGVAVREKRFETAAAALSSANARLNQPALVVREYLVRRQGGMTAPEAPLERWLERNPNDRVVLHALGEYRLSQGRMQEALAVYRRLLDGNPRDAVALNNAAWVSATLGDTGALSLAERAYEVAPSEPSVADTLGWVLVREGEHQRALDVLNTARKAANAPPDVEHHYAMALVGLGRKDEAKAVLDSLLARNISFSSRADAQSLRVSLDK